MLTMEKARLRDLPAVRRLYGQAFPPEEQLPFWSVWRDSEIWVGRMRGTFAGFLSLIARGDLVYLFFFAVAPELRGQGLGGKLIEGLKARYPGCRIFLAREPMDPAAENFPQRQARHRFYSRHGFRDLPLKTEENGYVYKAMGLGGDVAPEEYTALAAAWNPRLAAALKMRGL